ncbi:hypothetical protein P4J09_27455 [Bacillus cereus]|uniref:hypothetical protein n=1 Tax=Bacillus TaxID=1386 RepID=UPI0007389110|nr:MULTISPECIES: hypothetical protein [Bacillus]KAB2367240.1 hypothetical protein F8517_11600 [Bacillus thuringiensis]KUF26174.1 hypothetical protein AMR94_24940 [Bacillus sp. G3(2015)]MEB9381717.1 hypothetical protein [Bacillus cereus]
MRIALKENLRKCNFEVFTELGITEELILGSIQHCYKTLDTIDITLLQNGTPALSNLVELANLSSIVGNLLGEGCARNSSGKFTRNLPHTYPDLVCPNGINEGVEIKMALEKNSPKGHLAKAGFYLTYRYVLTDKDGTYIKGKENRQDTVTIWEVRCGYLNEDDFSLSNTEGDSGKTAVIRSESLNNMRLLYFDESCIPYRHTSSKPYKGFN